MMTGDYIELCQTLIMMNDKWGCAMKKEYCRMIIYKTPFPVTMPLEQYYKYKVFWEEVYKDDKGRMYSKVKKYQCYHSIEEMEADFAGDVQFMMYDEEIDMEAEYDPTDL